MAAAALWPVANCGALLPPQHRTNSRWHLSNGGPASLCRVFVLTLVSTALATSLFADMQPNYDNDPLQYGQIITPFALLSAHGDWFHDGHDGFLVRGDKHSLSTGGAPHAGSTAPAPPSSCRPATRTCAPCLRVQAPLESVALDRPHPGFDVFVRCPTAMTPKHHPR
jgi:membrane glycosyltransferase